MKKGILLLILLLSFSLVSCNSNLFEGMFAVGKATIEISDFILEEQYEVSKEQIEWFLASSNEWNLTFKTNENGEQTVEGYRRVINEQNHSITTNIYTRDFLEDEKNPQQIFDLSDVNQRNVEIKLYKISVGKDYYSNLVFRLSNNLYIQFVEFSPDKSRALTIQAFQGLSMLFMSQAKQYDYLKQNGSVKELEKSVLSANLNDYGSYIFEGFAHANKFNEAYIKVLDSDTSEEYYNQLTYKKEQFSIGWSDNAREYFYFSQKLIVPIPFYGKGPESANVIAQLWVEEIDGDSYCAASTQLDMEFWQR